jgi:hypothetical protein
VLFGNVTFPQKGVALAQLLPCENTVPENNIVAAKKNSILFISEILFFYKKEIINSIEKFNA